MLKLVTAKKLRGFLAFLFFLIPILAHAQKPGSFYWGDSDMDGIISGIDYSTLVSVYLNNTQNDADLYVGYPQSRYRQDLDGDGLISGADISFLKSWFVGNWNTYGAPDSLVWAGASVGLTIDPADTVGIEISAVSYSSASAGHWPRTGFGIIFAIDPASQCASTAQIYGFDPVGGATTWAWRNPLGYDYQPTLQAPELGIASVKLRATGCTNGQVIRVKAYIPGDMEYLVPGQRFPTRLDAARLLEITVIDITPPETFINSAPANPTNSKDASFEFSCSETGCAFECRLDAGGWSACSSPKNYSALLDGLHTFEVRATDSSLNTDPTPATLIWRIDTIPPTLNIYEPAMNDGITSSYFGAITLYSDTGSGVNISSFVATLNGVDVTTSFTTESGSATGTVSGNLGPNLLSVTITDYAGNIWQDAVPFFLSASPTPPMVTIISPVDGSANNIDCPLMQTEFHDPIDGLDVSTLEIKLDDVDRTYMFSFESDGDTIIANWQLTPEWALSVGSTHVVTASVGNFFEQISSATSAFFVNQAPLHPAITGISPVFAMPGDTVWILGQRFSANPPENVALFSNNKIAIILQASETQLLVEVPQDACSGPVKVIVNGDHSNLYNFIVGLNYGFVANNDNAFVSNGATRTVSVIDFDTSTPGTVINQITRPDFLRPFDVALSPDGKIAYVTDNTANLLVIIDAVAAADTVAGAILDSATVSSPRNVKVSPDGLEVFVGAGSGMLKVFRNHVANRYINIGGTVNEIAASPAAQVIYIVSSSGSGAAGKVKYFSIDKSASYLSGNTVQGTAYRGQTGAGIKPDQSEVYVANNFSNASSDAYSFSVLDVNSTFFERAQTAIVQPSGDAHDVCKPYDVVFDPLGQMLYSSFSGGGNIPNWATNNIGAHKWRAATGNFEAASNSDTVTPTLTPRGMAFAPGGHLLFAANFGTGSGAGNGSNLTILDHDKVKLAIDNDASDARYNLSGTNARSLDWVSANIPEYAGMVKSTGQNFDGPQNIAFQEFPVIITSRAVVHLAPGGQDPVEANLTLSVNPVYGNTVVVGLDSGATATIKDGETGDFHEILLGPGRDVFNHSNLANVSNLTLSARTPGIGEIIATAHGYPSNVVFVTVPPQVFIRILYAEACQSANDLTHRSLAAVVKNRIRLTTGFFANPNIGSGLMFGFPNDSQVTASNAGEDFCAQQIDGSFDFGYDSKTNNTPRYQESEFLSNVPAAGKSCYHSSVRAAGDALVDLMRTLTEGDTLWNMPQPDPNRLDIAQDPTGGSFFFYSPNNTEWGDTAHANSIKGTLVSGSTIFPSDGNFESDIVCTRMAHNFCSGPSNNKASYLQVVVVDGIPINDCAGTTKNKAPQFIFLRWRNNDQPAVLKLP